MMIAKSSKWPATHPRNVFFLFGLKIMTDTMDALLMMILNLLENSGALLVLTQSPNNMSVEVATGVHRVIVDKTATLKKEVKVR